MADEFVSADEAVALLQVKKQTLYAYVSRGWLASIPNPRSNRSRLYSRADLERLKHRADARAAAGPVAATALDWGAPVLVTSICEIQPSGPVLRGTPLGELLERPFEEVAELLWNAQTTSWSLPAPAAHGGPFMDRLRAAALAAEFADAMRDVPTQVARVSQARGLVGAMVAGLGGDGVHVAERVTRALGGAPQGVSAVNTALVVCAEHELNASTFACRVAASTGANLYACVSAALAAFVGPRHGAASRRIQRLLQECARDPAKTLLDRLCAAEQIPGFGHTLYPNGDPRFDMLMARAHELDPRAVKPIAELCEAAQELGLGRPNLDMGLVALARAAGLADGAETAIFALGRTAGWVAHAIEQAESGVLLRPRATFVGSVKG